MTEAERVVMLWPAELKSRVRELVGGRGLSAFVIEAVEDKLQQLEVADAGSASGAEPAGDLIVESVERVDAVPAQFDASTKHERTAHIEQNFGLQRASKLDTSSAAPTVDQPEEVNPSSCPACHAPLIDGECWACHI